MLIGKRAYKVLKEISYERLGGTQEEMSALNILKREDYSSYRMLVAMSILGVKFFPALLENFDNISLQEFERIIEFLVNNGYIVQLNNLSFEFKSNDIWKSIVSLVKNDESFEEIFNLYPSLAALSDKSPKSILPLFVLYAL